MSSNTMKYVVITPARNEEDYIEKTIQSMIAQTVLPKKWVIVSDASTDKTDEIVRRYLEGRPWMELIRMPEERNRSFAAKATCFKAGYDRMANDEYDLIANIDADISFDPDTFEILIEKFNTIPKLGLAGTYMREEFSDPTQDTAFEEQDVFGAFQLFRREVFEEIGGYIPLKYGGIDWTAVRMVRLKGWITRNFPDKVFIHYRPSGTANRSVLQARFDYGWRDWYFGNHPLWQVLRVVFKLTRKPYVIGGLALLAGYLSAMILRPAREVPKELLQYNRREQMEKMGRHLSQRIPFLFRRQADKS